MRIYLAARYSRRLEMCAHADELKVLGHTITSRWLDGTREAPRSPSGDLIDGVSPYDTETRCGFALEDRSDLLEADICICFTEGPRSDKGRGGRHVEFGMALGAGKPCFVIGPRENVFHCLPQVVQFDTWQDFMGWFSGTYKP